ncbi:MAG: hypothetical protein ACRD3W_11455 [Terriglobales bacterium]
MGRTTLRTLQLSITMMVGAMTLSAAPALAQHHQVVHSTPAHLILFGGQCPQLGDNIARWINVHGHHALFARSFDESDDAGFDIFVDSNGHFPPNNHAPNLPPGVISFIATSTSSKPLFLDIVQYNVNSNCNNFEETFEVPPSGIVNVRVQQGAAGFYVYLDGSGDNNATFSDFTFNGHPISLSTVLDQSDANSLRYCGPFPGSCEGGGA